MICKASNGPACMCRMLNVHHFAQPDFQKNLLAPVILHSGNVQMSSCFIIFYQRGQNWPAIWEAKRGCEHLWACQNAEWKRLAR